MYLENWEPFVCKSKRMSGEPEIYFSAELKCPCCDEMIIVESEGNFLVPKMEIMIGHKVRDLAERRDCPNCGVVSSLPKKDRDRLQKEALEKITREKVMEVYDLILECNTDLIAF